MGALNLGLSVCVSQYGDPKMFGISSEKEEYASIGAAQTKESVRSAIAEDATMIVTRDINGTESTAIETDTETNSFGAVSPSRDKPGMDIIHLNSDPADHNGYVGAFRGGVYYVEPYLTGPGGNFKLLHKNEDGTLRGFPAKLWAKAAGTPSFENKTQQFNLNCYWTNVEDWNNIVLVPTVDDFDEYVDMMPTGLDTELQGSYAATNQTIKIWDRGDITALVATTQTVVARTVSSNVSVPAVSVGVPSVDGECILTVTKGSAPATLIAGNFIDYVIYILNADAVTVDYTTNIIRIKG